MALAALDEIAERCQQRPAPKSASLRFLLDWLFQETGGEPANKWLFDDFWRCVTGKRSTDRAFLDGYERSTGAQSALNGICRLCGWERTHSFELEMRKRRRPRRGAPAKAPAPTAAGADRTEA